MKFGPITGDIKLRAPRVWEANVRAGGEVAITPGLLSQWELEPPYWVHTMPYGQLAVVGSVEAMRGRAEKYKRTDTSKGGALERKASRHLVLPTETRRELLQHDNTPVTFINLGSTALITPTHLFAENLGAQAERDPVTRQLYERFVAESLLRPIITSRRTEAAEQLLPDGMVVRMFPEAFPPDQMGEHRAFVEQALD